MNHSIFAIPSGGPACPTCLEVMIVSDRGLTLVKARRRLSPSEKFELFVQVLTGQATQREAAANCGWTASPWCASAGP